MNISRYFFFLCLSFLLLGGCNSKKAYDNASDKVVLDLTTDINELTRERDKILEEKVKVLKAAKNPDTDLELKKGLETEAFQIDHWEKEMFEQIAYLKIRRNQRIDLLNNRKRQNLDYSDQATKECADYFQDKELNPMKKGWENRYRAAIDI